MATNAELIELGLAKSCDHIVVSEIRGKIFREFCGKETISFGGRCSRHDNTAELVKQEKLAIERTVLTQRKFIEEELFPKITQRVMAIVDDPEAKNADVIKIWMTVMDRIGMGAVQGLVVEGQLSVEAPIDILRAMLQTHEVVDAEVVEPEPHALGAPGAHDPALA